MSPMKWPCLLPLRRDSISGSRLEPGSGLSVDRLTLALILLWIFWSTGCEIMPLPGEKVVFAGDSLTARWGKYWPRVFPETFRDYVDAGVEGNTSEALLQRFSSTVLSAQPDVVHILIGTNDSFSAVNYGTPRLEVTEGNIAQMSILAQAQGVKVVLGTVPPFAREEPASTALNNHVRSLNRWIRGFAASHGFGLVDYYILLERDGYLRPEMCIDRRVHLTALAYETISPQTLAVLNSYLRPR